MKEQTRELVKAIHRLAAAIERTPGKPPGRAKECRPHVVRIDAAREERQLERREGEVA